MKADSFRLVRAEHSVHHQMHLIEFFVVQVSQVELAGYRSLQALGLVVEVGLETVKVVVVHAIFLPQMLFYFVQVFFLARAADVLRTMTKPA